MTIFFFWIIFSFVAGALGSSRTIGFWGAFFVSILLSPLIGFIVVFASRHKDVVSAPSSGTISPEPEILPDKSDYINELKELSELKDQGIITENEFSERKIAILKKNN